jgi:hypothetical protein
MHTQHDTAKAIIGRQADYVMTVKANMPACTGSSRSCPGPPSRVSAVSTDRGRRARRNVKAALAPS